MNQQELTSAPAGRVAALPAGLLRRAAPAAALFGIGALLVAGVLSLEGKGEVASQRGIAPLVAQQARHLDAQAPLRIDAGTTLLGVAAAGNRMVFRMRISEDVPAGDIEATRTRIRAESLRELCADADTRRMIDRGAIFDRRYTDASGDSFRAEIRSCAGRGSAGKTSLPMAM